MIIHGDDNSIAHLPSCVFLCWGYDNQVKELGYLHPDRKVEGLWRYDKIKTNWWWSENGPAWHYAIEPDDPQYDAYMAYKVTHDLGVPNANLLKGTLDHVLLTGPQLPAR